MADRDDTLESLASLPSFRNPTVSHDGESVALYYDVTGRNELHVVDVGTGTLEQWSSGEVPRDTVWRVEWSAADDRVFFHRDEDGDEQNDVLAIDRDGAVEPVVEMDGQVVIQGVEDTGERLLLRGNRDGQNDLYAHDLASGETTKLTDHERSVGSAHLSPGGDRIAYGTNESDDRDNWDVYVAAGDGSNPRNLHVGEHGATAGPADWHPDGDRLLLGDTTEDLERCGVYDLADGSVTWYGDREHEEEPSFFLPGGDRFVATRVRGVTRVPVVYDVETGESREFDVPEGVTWFGLVPGGNHVVDDDRVLLVHSSATRRPTLLVYDLATDEYDVLLAPEYGPFSPEDFAEARHVTFASDGIPDAPARAVDHDPYEEFEIDALLYDSGVRPSPLVVKPHGGPSLHDSNEFDLYVQFLVRQGYSVLQVNYRGSTGRGRSFREALYGDWGGAEQGDVATGVEYVLDAHDWLDEDRVAVFGGSYGGYSAAWQLVQYPDLYDAGVAWIAMTDLADMYETTVPHFQDWLERHLGAPAENPDLYEARSPVTHAGNVEAPLLVVHGVNDPRVSVSQARRFRDALEDAGFEAGEAADFEYVELGAEGHGSGDIDRKIRLFGILEDFLDRRLDAD